MKCSSVALHALFEAMGCPVGRKVDGWCAADLAWIHDLAAWQRAHAEGRKPTPAELASARARVDWRAVTVSTQALRLQRPGTAAP